MSNKNSLTFYLFALPSFAEGYARVIDIGGNLNVYNYSSSPEEADYRALRCDWITVGQDIKGAIQIYERSVATTTRK
jgi:hypothetical protein